MRPSIRSATPGLNGISAFFPSARTTSSRSPAPKFSTATTVPSYEVYNRAFNLKMVGSASAVAIVLTILVFVINVAISRIGEEKVVRR